jgi:tripartite-type tricarboxylate transporter receptor subunit TctC
LLAAATALIAITVPASAQDAKPRSSSDKLIRIVVPYAPGGYTDIIARLISQKMSERLGQTVIVENKPGASTILGAEFVAKAPADGNTLLMGVTTTLSSNQFMFRKLPYKTSDFIPVALTGLTPFVLVAHPSVPANNVGELVALAKAKPGTLNVATLGVGASTQLVAEMFKSAARVDIKDVPYKGSAPASTDLLAGHVQLYFDAVPTAMPRVRAGQLKAIGITSEARSPAAPMLATFVESGLPEMVAYSWYGLLAPAGTPQEVVDTLNKAANEALQLPDVRAQVEANGATAPIMSPAEFGALIEKHTKVWEKIIKPLNIQLD